MERGVEHKNREEGGWRAGTVAGVRKASGVVAGVLARLGAVTPVGVVGVREMAVSEPCVAPVLDRVEGCERCGAGPVVRLAAHWEA